jgi:hypothetical protein
MISLSAPLVPTQATLTPGYDPNFPTIPVPTIIPVVAWCMLQQTPGTAPVPTQPTGVVGAGNIPKIQ